MDLQSLIQIIVVLMVVGICVWLIVTYVPMQPPFPQLIIAAAAILVVLWILSAFVGGGNRSLFRCSELIPDATLSFVT